ncbi:hypothetical protein Bca52824_045716 [Brassica carinata]|uniref:ubiquitinyl hydrolase 1 n=1 Tax=Brassica carinata TaxID=52824 RepID=A0A8X7UPF2_BRACI|nr:hypothetical protein Bca52824_045716 [Brassica carinata]
MARILVQRGSSSNASRSTSSSSGSSSSSGTEPPQASSNAQVPPVTIDEETSTDGKQEEVIVVEPAECSEAQDVSLPPSDELVDREDDEGLVASENVVVESEGVDCDSPDSLPLPVPPPKPSSNDNRRSVLRRLTPPRSQNPTVLSICHALCPLILALALAWNTRDHFSQFITEGFTSYLKRKRRNKVYGNNVEIQALAEMYNRPIHIYSYSTEPINIFQGSYNTDTPPIRLSYHHGNHYNSLVDPHRLTVGAGLGFGSLSGRHVDREQVKAAIKAQQEHQIDNALLAEGRYYSDLELTEKEIERSVMEASRAEYLMEWSKPRIGPASNAETSSSGARTDWKQKEAVKEKTVVMSSSSIDMVLSMGFSYTQAMEAYSIFGDDVDSIVCYVLETSCGSTNNRRKGKATE